LGSKACNQSRRLGLTFAEICHPHLETRYSWSVVDDEAEVSQQPAQPGRFRAARDLRGLTQQQVVKRMSRPITVAALSQIEVGKVRPSNETVRDLASALEVPAGFFSAPWPAPSDRAPVTYFRDLRATPARERRRATAFAILLNDLVGTIERHVRLPDVRLPVRPIGVEATRQELEEAAEAVRLEWDLGAGPIPHVVRELERHGIAVARLAMGHRTVDAFSVRFERRPIVLLTTDKSNYVRSRFDAAHELGHLVMHTEAEPGNRLVESQAHDFASCLLLPQAVALRELPTRLDAAGWTRLAQLKQKWGISMSAMLYRARALGLVGPDAYRNAMRYMSGKGWRTTEPGDRELGPAEAPLLFERGLRTVEVESGHELHELIESAHLPLVDTVELVKAAVDSRPIVEL
jgi:Zn-dependent peptidase ImmA (M78 family)/DNA-binding XRE family transcriptional regulator